MDVKRWIKHHEGMRLKPYKDIVDKITIGYGRNIEDNGITKEEAEFLFENDFKRCVDELSIYPWYTDQPVYIKNCLINMCFNMGIKRLLGFKRMIAALEKRDYVKAAIEAMDSKWAQQVKSRAVDIALVMRQGHA